MCVGLRYVTISNWTQLRNLFYFLFIFRSNLRQRCVILRKECQQMVNVSSNPIVDRMVQWAMANCRWCCLYYSLVLRRSRSSEAFAILIMNSDHDFLYSNFTLDVMQMTTITITIALFKRIILRIRQIPCSASVYDDNVAWLLRTDLFGLWVRQPPGNIDSFTEICIN